MHQLTNSDHNYLDLHEAEDLRDFNIGFHVFVFDGIVKT